jgi:menaquinone-9 beta-reductase
MYLQKFATEMDVFIAGAGPAGLACAIASALRGLNVHVADAMEPPIDKACGEGLLPDAVESLASLGIDLVHSYDIHDSREAHPLRGIRFIGDRGVSAQAVFNAQGFGIRRTVLHKLLFDRATALGVKFHWKNSVQGIEPRSTGILVRSNRQLLHTRFLVGADGHHSRIASWAGLTEAVVQSRRIGLRQHYNIAPWTDFVEVHWSNFGQAYVTPNSADEVCVAFVANKKFASAEQALSHFPALRHHLSASQPSDPPRGSITLGRKLRRVTTGNIALIGDASGSVDAVTGEGIALCFRQAEALAIALRDGNLALYQQAHRRIQRLPSLMSRSLLLMDHSPLLRDIAFRTLQRNPSLFERLLQVHIGHSPLQFLDDDGLLGTGSQSLVS